MTHYIFALDLSGSMSSSISSLKSDLKNKISTMISPKDYLSIIYFSGKNQAGIILEKYNISDPDGLTNAHQAIDRWVMPMGLTAFEKPLNIAKELTNKADINVLLFMTDGYNNDCSTESVIEAAKDLNEYFDATYFVEYGYYCDSKFLQKLAEKSNGISLTAKDFNSLSDIFASALVTPQGKKQEVMVIKDQDDYIFVSVSTGDVIAYPVPKELPAVPIAVPVDTMDVCSDSHCDDIPTKLVCALGNLMIGRAEMVEKHLKDINNNELYQVWVNCYGKQKLQDFAKTLKSAIMFPEELDVENPITVTEDQLSVYGLLGILNERNAKVQIDSYQAIGRKKDTDICTPAQQAHISTLKSKKDIDSYLETLKPLEFIYDDRNAPIELRSLTFNSSRANVSILVKYEGKVTLPENQWAKEYRTFQYRNYNIIKDGIINMETLIVQKDGFIEDMDIPHNDLVDNIEIRLNEMPVITRKELQSVTALDLAKKAIELEHLKATQKVLNYYDLKFRPDSKQIEDDPEFSAFLKTFGITRNGFAPPSHYQESEDFYYAPSIDIKIKGLSSLPSVESVIKKLEDKSNLTVSDQLIQKGINIVTGIKDTPNFTVLLKTLTEENLKSKRELERSVSKDIASIILSKGWFPDLKDFNDNIVAVDGFTVTFDYKDISVKI